MSRLSGDAGRRLTWLAVAVGLVMLVAAPVLRAWVTPVLAQSPQDPGGDGFVTFTSTGVITTLFDLESAESSGAQTPIPLPSTAPTFGPPSGTEGGAEGSSPRSSPEVEGASPADPTDSDASPAASADSDEDQTSSGLLGGASAGRVAGVRPVVLPSAAPGPFEPETPSPTVSPGQESAEEPPSDPEGSAEATPEPTAAESATPGEGADDAIDLPEGALLVTRTLTSRGDLAAAQQAAAEGLNVAVVDTSDRAVTEDGALLSETSYRLAADRRTQALADCCGTEIAGASLAVGGAGNPLRLPWFTPHATYPYFDTTLMAAVDLAYIGTDRVEDMEVLKFQQSTAPTAIGTVPVPGQLVGSEQETVTLARAYSVNRTLWVDPTTGIIIRTAERIREALRDEAGAERVILLSMTLTSTPEQEQAQMAQAHAEGRPVLWAHSYGPMLLLGVGGLLLVLGLVGVGVRARARRAAEEFPDEPATFEDLREIFD